MLNSAFWWLLAVKFLAFWKLQPRSWGGQYIVGPPTWKLGGPVSPGPCGCCAYGSRTKLIPYLAVSLQATACIVINVMVGCYHLPPGPQWHICIVMNPAVGLQLPSQPSCVIALRPVPTYTAWWHDKRHIGMRNLPREPGQDQTHELLFTAPTLYRQHHHATMIINNWKNYHKNLGWRLLSTGFCGDGYQLISYNSPQLLLKSIKLTDHLSKSRCRVGTIGVLADFQN